ncbi:MAG: polysaccharide biosynthesis tyrosine autokinase [Gammaproteobacteria bacterium]|nr:polysaccharide biosynthesis tyrosine autokinase [Gammaproteobacteria bacterium]
MINVDGGMENKNQTLTSKIDAPIQQIDFRQLPYVLWQRRKWVAFVCLTLTIIVGVSSFIRGPQFQSDAMLHIESGKNALNILSDLPISNELLGNGQQSERDILQSRAVLGKTVKELNLDIQITANYFPLLSGWILRNQMNPSSSPPFWLPDGYTWQDESVRVSRLDLPRQLQGLDLVLNVSGSDSYQLLGVADEVLLSGKVGIPSQQGDIYIHVDSIHARDGVRFGLRKIEFQDAIKELRKRIRVTGGSKRTTDIVHISYHDSDPRSVEVVLNSIINNYVSYNITSHTEVAEKTLRFIESQLEKFSADVAFNNELYLMLLTKAHELKVMKAGTLGNVRVVDNAFVPNRPEGMGILSMIAIASLLGLLLGMVVAILRHYMDHTLYDPKQIESNLNIPVYTTIPLSQAQIKLNKQGWKISGNGNICQGLLFKDVPDDPAMEAIRFLRAMIEDGDLRGKQRVIAITGPSPNVGKTFLSTNLACLLSELGLSVLLIDADLRRGVVHEYFALEKECGLAEYLTESVTLESIIKYSGLGQMDVITRGGNPDNPSVLMSSSRLKLLLDECRQNYDIILIDTPPALAVTDATIIARHVDQLLMVVKAGLTTMDEVSVCWKRLTQSGKCPSGLVMSGYDPSKLGYSKYQQYGYY